MALKDRSSFSGGGVAQPSLQASMNALNAVGSQITNYQKSKDLAAQQAIDNKRADARLGLAQAANTRATAAEARNIAAANAAGIQQKQISDIMKTPVELGRDVALDASQLTAQQQLSDDVDARFANGGYAPGELNNLLEGEYLNAISTPTLEQRYTGMKNKAVNTGNPAVVKAVDTLLANDVKNAATSRAAATKAQQGVIKDIYDSKVNVLQSRIKAGEKFSTKQYEKAPAEVREYLNTEYWMGNRKEAMNVADGLAKMGVKGTNIMAMMMDANPAEAGLGLSRDSVDFEKLAADLPPKGAELLKAYAAGKVSHSDFITGAKEIGSGYKVNAKDELTKVNEQYKMDLANVGSGNRLATPSAVLGDRLGSKGYTSQGGVTTPDVPPKKTPTDTTEVVKTKGKVSTTPADAVSMATPITNEELVDVNRSYGLNADGMASNHIYNTTPEGDLLPEGIVRLVDGYYNVGSTKNVEQIIKDTNMTGGKFDNLKVKGNEDTVDVTPTKTEPTLRDTKASIQQAFYDLISRKTSKPVKNRFGEMIDNISKGDSRFGGIAKKGVTPTLNELQDAINSTTISAKDVLPQARVATPQGESVKDARAQSLVDERRSNFSESQEVNRIANLRQQIKEANAIYSDTTIFGMLRNDPANVRYSDEELKAIIKETAK